MICPGCEKELEEDKWKGDFVSFRCLQCWITIHPYSFDLNWKIKKWEVWSWQNHQIEWREETNSKEECLEVIGRMKKLRSFK